MKKTAIVSVNAKINLSLCVNGKQGDYHELDSIVASVDISDVISVTESNRDEITFSACGVDSYKSNAFAALGYMRNRYALPHVSINVMNDIPCGAGLGGSSADCAGVILALDKLFSLDLSLETMREIANRFGSDTAYMLSGGYARLRGRGEIIEPFESCFSPEILIACKGEVSTGKCFTLFDRLSSDKKPCAVDELKAALISDDEEKIKSLVRNDLTDCACSLNGDIARIFEIAKPCRCVMTGSGAGVVIFDATDETESALSDAGITVIKTRILPSRRGR